MDLKPCPFCGGDECEIIKLNDASRSGFCPDCQMTGPVGDTVQDAADLWNRRPTAETPPQMPDSFYVKAVPDDDQATWDMFAAHAFPAVYDIFQRGGIGERAVEETAVVADELMKVRAERLRPITESEDKADD